MRKTKKGCEMKRMIKKKKRMHDSKIECSQLNPLNIICKNRIRSRRDKKERKRKIERKKGGERERESERERGVTRQEKDGRT